MAIHPKILSRLFANAVETRSTPDQAAARLGRYVVLGHLPEQVSADPAVVTDASGRLPNIRAMHKAGLFLDMVCWPLGDAPATVRVGRDQVNDLVVPDVRVSHRHATLHIGDVVALEDLGSSSGSAVNGEKLIPRQRRVLQEQEVVSFGGFELHLLGAVKLMEMLLNTGPGPGKPLNTPFPRSAS